MIVSKIVQGSIQYIIEGFIKIFSPSNDDYPTVGVQPFGGTIKYRDRHSRFDW